MVEFNQNGSDAVVHVIENNIVRMSAMEKGDQFYIPKKPTWLADQMGSNPNARARVLAVELIPNGEPTVKELYYNQLSRVDRKTKQLVCSDAVNMAIHKGGNKAFDKTAGGKIIAVKEVVEANDYKRDQNQNRENDADGNPMFQPTKAFAFEVKPAGNFKDADAEALVAAYLAANYTKREPLEDGTEE